MAEIVALPLKRINDAEHSEVVSDKAHAST